MVTISKKEYHELMRSFEILQMVVEESGNEDWIVEEFKSRLANEGMSSNWYE